ncbi:hypothetical protein ACPVPU_05680 [Sphingomonas sp. CJ99]
MRVSDVLEMLAGGATPAEIAADFSMSMRMMFAPCWPMRRRRGN